VILLKPVKIILKFLLILSTSVIILAAVLAIYYASINTKSAKVYLDQRHKNITYKETETGKLKLDIYMPKRKLFAKIPVLVYFHGGGWDSGSKNISGKELEIVNGILEAGFAVVSVDYRLTSDTNKFPVHHSDGADAIRWIIKNADTYGFNKNKINLIGASAGGHMALLLGIAGNQFGDDTSDFRIRSIIDLCGPTDLADLSDYTPSGREWMEGVLYNFIGGTYEEKKEAYEFASPINHIRKDMPPIFMTHGMKDDLIPFAQAEKFYNKALSAKAKVTFVPVKNGNHYFDAPKNEELDPPIIKIAIKMLVFLLKHNLF
jgi:acetyl esterase/lipase